MRDYLGPWKLPFDIDHPATAEQAVAQAAARLRQLVTNHLTVVCVCIFALALIPFGFLWILPILAIVHSLYVIGLLGVASWQYRTNPMQRPPSAELQEEVRKLPPNPKISHYLAAVAQQGRSLTLFEAQCLVCYAEDNAHNEAWRKVAKKLRAE